MQWITVILVLCGLFIQQGFCGLRDMATPMSVEFKSWAQCARAATGPTHANIEKAIINRIGPNQVAISLDINVEEDFGLPEFTMFVEMKGSDSGLDGTFIVDKTFDIDDMCESLNDPKSIIAVAIELMGFPKGTKCPIPAGLYQSVDKKIEIPLLAMSIFEKYAFWQVELKMVNNETKACHMCFNVFLEVIKAGGGRKKDHSGKFGGKRG